MEIQAILDVIKAFFDAILAVLKEIGFIKDDATTPETPEAPKAEG